MAAKTTLTVEIWFGVTFVRARNAAEAFAHSADREAIGRGSLRVRAWRPPQCGGDDRPRVPVVGDYRIT